MRRGSALTRATVLALLAAGCGGESEPAGSAPCSPPSRLIGDRCLQPGVGDDGCPAGTLGQMDLSCRPAGMLPEDCAAGFAHDGDVACEPVLPPEPCPPGALAVPGDRGCRPVLDCGSGKWGNIAVDGATEYVDASFDGTSDGSAAAPWTTINAAVAASSRGGLVAVAAGSYTEDVFIEGKPVRLHGVCPALVEVVGTGAALATIVIRSGATGSEVRGLAVRGAANGLVLSGSEQVLFEALWLHDNASRGVNVQSTLGPTSCTVRGSLLERNGEISLFISGAETNVEASAVRDTQPVAGFGGRGIAIQIDPFTGAAARVAVRGALFERNEGVSVYVSGAEATVEATVIRDTSPYTQPVGSGIVLEPELTTGAVARATLRTSLLERNHAIGVYAIGSEIAMEATVVRDTQPEPLILNSGFDIEPYVPAGAFGRATVRTSLIERNHETGLAAFGEDVTVESTVIRDTRPVAGRHGRGIHIQRHPDAPGIARATLRGSIIERNREFGVLIAGAEATVEAVKIDRTSPNEAGLAGDGLTMVFLQQLASPTVVSIHNARIDESARAGLSNFSSFVSLGATAIGCAAFPLAGEPVDGVDFVLEDRGANGCGCPAADSACKLVSAGLEPPDPLAPAE